MNRTLFTISLLNIFALLTPILCAQNTKIGIPHIQHFNRRQYNGSTQNWKITQSENGLIYSANKDGLLEYDGETWKLYKEMNSPIVRCTKAIGDRVYASAINELGYFKYNELGQFKYHSYSNQGNLVTLGDYWEIYEWQEKIVFHSQQGLSVFKNDSLQYFIQAPSQFTDCFLINGILIVQDEKEGLMEVRGEDVFPIAGGHIFKGKIIASLIELSKSEILIGTMNEGVFLWNMSSIKPYKWATNDLLKKVNIFCATRYNPNLLVFGTIQKGVIITDNKGNLVMQIDKDRGLENNTVLSLFIDNEENIWCGLDNGIARINLNSGITFINSFFDIGTGYITDKHKNDWYFGTNQGLFTISDKTLKNPLKTRDDFKKINGSDGQVWSLFFEDNNLLCGHNRGIFDIVNNNSELITPPYIKGVWNFKPTPKDSNMIICGTYNGLILLHKKNNRWQFYKQIDNFNESSKYIEWDKVGNLWVSHGYKGVYKLQFSDDYEKILKVDHYTTEYFSKNGGVVINKINNNIVVSCKDKLYKIEESGSIGEYKKLDQYFEKGNYPLSLKQDDQNNIWYFFAENLGVLRLLENGSYTKIENPFAPLKQKLINSFENIYTNDSKNALFGIEDGYAHYTAEDNNNFHLPIKVHLRSFKGNSDSIDIVFNQDTSLTQHNIPTYKYRDNTFEVHYASPFFEDEAIQYSTQLIGLDKAPTEWSNNTFRQFTKLREGDYQFVIRAKNCYGVISEPLRYSFNISPPWHRSNEAKVIYIIFLLLLIIAIIFIFNKRVEARQIKEKIKQRERYKAKEELLTKEALQAEKEVIKLRNDKLRNDMLHKEKELANSTINIIHKNDFLNQIKENLKSVKTVKDVSQLQQKVNRLIKKIDKDIDNESNWQIFEVHLEHIHEDFLKRLSIKHPDLSRKEQKLCAYIRMGMTSKEIASLMNVSSPTVDNHRYKLRQKLNIEHGENLIQYILNI